MQKATKSSTYVSIPTIISITDVSSSVHLHLPHSFTVVEETKAKQRNPLKTICVNVEQILPELDGVEVSETV